MFLFLALLGCPTPDPRVDAFPDLASPSGSRAVRLDPADARLDLVQGPEIPVLGDRFVLDHEEVPNSKGVPRALAVLRAKLPFTTPPGRSKPPGLRVEVEGQEIPFSRAKAHQAAKPSWRVNGKHLVLSLPTNPPPGSIVVHWAEARKTLERFDLAASGLEPADFASTSLTLRGATRDGLLLTAPATAEWDVTLPDGASFDTWLAIPRAPLREPTPDPASVVLEIIENGSAIEVARKEVRRDDPGFDRWTVDLAPWSGRAATLRLRADPHDNPAYDWVFAGSPTVHGRPTGPVRRVVVLAMDTTRPDHFGFYGYDRGSTPELDRIGRESVTFDRTWSVAPRTRPAFRSAFTGRLPLDAVGRPNLAESLQEAGWATAGIVANIHLQPRFDFDHGFDWWLYDNSADAQQQVDRGIQWLEAHADRDAFLFLHFMDPHMPYAAPGEFKDRYVTNPDPSLPPRYDHWAVNKWTLNGKITDQRKAHIEALHDGEMAYMSAQIGRFVEALDRMEGRTLLVVHTDHGEEFWEHGAFEHNHSLFDETTRSVLWFRPGRGLREGRRVTEPSSLLDLAPTLAEVLAIEDPPDFDGMSLAAHLAGAPTATGERPIPVGYLQYREERWGVVFRDHKYILHTGTGQEELFRLSDDPEERVDRSGEVDLAPWREALARAHAVDVRPGLRIHVDRAAGTAPLEIRFGAPVRDAGLLDPETTIAHRANIEWGQKPKRLPEDVGTVELSAERDRLVYTPGPQPEGGVIWVQGDAPIPVDPIVAAIDGKPVDLVHTDSGRQWRDGHGGLRIVAGTVLVPPLGEAARMRALRGDQDVDEDELEKLRALGYVEPEEDEP